MSRAGSCQSVGNLPAEVTSFVGRRGEVAAAKRLLRRHRLVTLTGGAGVGKTRLALRIAARLADAVPDGVWLVEFLHDNDLLVSIRSARLWLTVAGHFELVHLGGDIR